MTRFADTIPKMHDLYDVFLARALTAFSGQDMPPAKLHRLVQTLARMVRMIMSTEVWMYQRALKTKMLADPAWRSRVIDEVGGYWALRRWRARMALGYQPPREPPEDMKDTASCGKLQRPRSGHIDPRQFRLAPMSRSFYGAREADIFAPFRIYEPAPCVSGFDRPIPLTAEELAPLPPPEPPRRNLFYPHLCPYRQRSESPPPKPEPP